MAKKLIILRDTFFQEKNKNKKMLLPSFCSVLFYFVNKGGEGDGGAGKSMDG